MNFLMQNCSATNIIHKVFKKGFVLLLIAIPFNRALSQALPDPHFHIYLLMGQSNMAGRGPITDSLKNEGNNRVLMLNSDGKFVLAKHPVHFDKPKMDGVGPGLAFGIAMAIANPKVTIGLVPCAVGGTPIEHWLPGAYDEATKTHPYDDAVERIKTAMQAGVIKGVIWHQGESNSGEAKSKAYLAQLSELIARVRKLTNNPNLPFVVGELGRYRPAYAYINTELAKLPATVPYTALATSEGLVHKGDTTHFNGSSAEIFGRRFAVKMLELQQYQKTQKK